MARVYGGQTAEQRAETRREAFLEAGLEVLSSRGWSGATVREICAEASLSSRLFYEAFDGLEELAVALYEGIVEDVFARVGEAILSGETRQERSRHGMRALVGALTEDPRRGRVVLSAGFAEGPLRELRAATLERFAGWVEAVGASELPAADQNPELIEVSAVLVAGGISELMSAFIDGRLTVDREQLATHAADLVVAIGEAPQSLG